MVKRRRDGREARLCWLCGVEKAGSREHVIPLWYSDHINPTRHVGMEPFDAEGKRRRNRSATINEITLKVCDDCNRGWMGPTFEEPASAIMKPMIGPAYGPTGVRPSVPLTADDRRMLIRWAWKTILMAGSTRDPGWFQMQAYRQFRASGQAPDDLSFVLGWYEGSSTAKWEFSVGPKRSPSILVTTLVMKPFIFQAIGFEPLSRFRISHSVMAPVHLRGGLILLEPSPHAPAATGFADPDLWPPEGGPIGDAGLTDMLTLLT